MKNRSMLLAAAALMMAASPAMAGGIGGFGYSQTVRHPASTKRARGKVKQNPPGSKLARKAAQGKL